MKFKKITSQDVKDIKKYLPKGQICNYSAATLLAWTDYNNFEFCIDDDVLYIKGETDTNEGIAFFPPFLGKDVKFCDAVKKVVDCCMERGVAPAFAPVSEEYFPQFCNIKSVEKLNIWSDYVYDSEGLSTFVGKKYHAKRNHINKFNSLYDWKFEDITTDRIEEVKTFLNGLDLSQEDETSVYEHNSTFLLLDNWVELELVGGILTVDGKIIGVSIGEISGDTLIEHTEKADKQYDGVFTVLCNQTAERFAQDCNYVNREEDMGDEGLRKSKLSYNPVKYLQKYRITLNF